MRNMVDVSRTAFDGDALLRLSTVVHESQHATRRGLDHAVPASLAGLAAHAAHRGGARDLLGTFRAGDYPHLGPAEVSSLVDNPDKTVELAESGERFLSHIFGENLDDTIDTIAEQSGVSRAAAHTLLGLAVPLVLDAVSKETESRHLGVRGLARLLNDQARAAGNFVPDGWHELGLAAGTSDDVAIRPAYTQPSRMPAVADRSRRASHVFKGLIGMVLLALVGLLGIMISGTHRATMSEQVEPGAMPARVAPVVAAPAATDLQAPMLAPESARSASMSGETVRRPPYPSMETPPLTLARPEPIEATAPPATEQSATEQSATEQSATEQSATERNATMGSSARRAPSEPAATSSAAMSSAATSSAAMSSAPMSSAPTSSAPMASAAPMSSRDPATDLPVVPATPNASEAIASVSEGELSSQPAASEPHAIVVPPPSTSRLGALPSSQETMASEQGADIESHGVLARERSLVLPPELGRSLPRFLDSSASPPRRFELREVPFKTHSAALSGEIPVLNSAAKALRAHPDVELLLEGHADGISEGDRADSLSLARALAVKNYLAARGVAEDRMRAVGFGGRRVPADDARNAPRVESRRVDLVVVKR